MFMQILQGSQQVRVQEVAYGLDLSKFVIGGYLDCVVGIDLGASVEGVVYEPEGYEDQGHFTSHDAIWADDVTRPSRLTVHNHGEILATNGSGGDAGTGKGHTGGDGGTCVNAACPITIYNHGRIACGGGGGGGGGGTSGDKDSSGGGGGYPGGVGYGHGSRPNRRADSSRFGYAEGDPPTEEYSAYNGGGGNCLGAGEVGEDGENGYYDGGHGGSPGHAIDSHGKGGLILIDTSNVIGDIV